MVWVCCVYGECVCECDCVKGVIGRSGVEWLVPPEVRRQLEPLVNTPVTAPVRFNFGLRWSTSRCSRI